MQKIKYAQGEIQKLLQTKFDFIELVDEYKNNHTKNIFFCKKCNKNFNKTIYSILNGKQPCPHCVKRENKERKINNFENKELIEGKFKFFRFCPDCNKKIYYNDVILCENSIKGNKRCYKCANTLSAKIYENGMKGKSVFQVWESKYGVETAILLNEQKKQKTSNTVKKINSTLTQEERNSLYGHLGKDNGFYGKKHTKETKEKNRQAHLGKHSGENNPMYGKPSPQGSGNGWSGWYKNIYFRSLLELSYLISLFENNIKFEPAETKKYSITYFNSFKKREANYFPDFFLFDTKEIIEVKPINLLNTQQNIDKFNKAKEIYGNKFKIVTEKDIIKIDKENLKKLILNKEVILLKRYEEKFNEYYNL